MKREKHVTEMLTYSDGEQIEHGCLSGNLMAEADGDNEITRYYIHGAGLLAMVTPSNQVYSYHFNGTGSTIAMTDAAQAVINQYRYDPFGNIINQSETVSNPFTFVGQYGVMTEPNGFYYMRARYYDPQVGRFISEDPIGFDGGDVNLYGYAGNNPVNRVDPKGLFNILFGGGASVTAPTGFDISGGIVVNPGLFGQKADVGVLGSAGVAGGINVSADAFIGIVRGGIENVRGLTSNFNLTIGPLSLTVFVDPKTGTIMGGTVGIGPAATPAGVSVSFPYTGHITARDIFSPTSTSAQSRGYSK